MLSLKFGFTFEDVNSLQGLYKLDESFLIYLKKQNPDLFQKIRDGRLSKSTMSPTEYSRFLVELAPILDDFISELFTIEDENLLLKQTHEAFDPIYECRRKFVQRYAVRKYPLDKLKLLDFSEVSRQLTDLLSANLLGKITERSIANYYLTLQTDPTRYEYELEILAQYCAFAVSMHSSLMLFDIPRPLNQNNHLREHRINALKEHIYLGFNYRDNQNKQDNAHAHAKYCIYCHSSEKDYCSKGIKNNEHEATDNKKGCPLKQKISEMNLLKSKGFNIAALAVAIIDNPLLALTGHRICNDCMKSCIYQKQDPVNIPLVESNILERVLSLPWGVEIYLLLTKWNPLNIINPLPLKPSGYNVLVVGLGPAGAALSHYLLNEGHNVTAIDGMRISPLGFNPNMPIKFWSDIKLSLERKIPQGFGGVAEYGITNRWDKNNLTLLRLLLQRRSNFNIFGGIRLGSNLTVKQALEGGFDHIALAVGAGKPRFDDISGYFAKGVRTAADFLMNLQQSGAFLKEANSNLQIRLPAVVIGCGLTAVDSAVELLHYYPLQVEKFLTKFERLNDSVNLNEEEKSVADEFIRHAKLFRGVKNDSEKLEIMQKLGGVTICYRDVISNSPAYRLNHEEIEHALALGIKFEEYKIPQEILTDRFGRTEKIKFTDGSEKTANTVLIAIGTETNEFQDIGYENEHNPNIFNNKDDIFSYFGDCNPEYVGSVVKALASAKNGYKNISDRLSKMPPQGLKLNIENYKSVIRAVKTLSDNIIELVIFSPLVVQNFKPGQFFKLQNYSVEVNKIMEPLALTGMFVDKQEKTISFAVYKAGISSRLCLEFKVGEEVALTGPIGMPVTIFSNKKIILIGEDFGNVALFSIGEALKRNKCEIIYFAVYSKSMDIFYSEKIAEFADIIIWVCEEKKIITTREQDYSFQGTIVEAVKYIKDQAIVDNTENIICMGSTKLTEIISARKLELFGDIAMSCGIYTNMQCMMKGICGQCIVKVNDERKYIFACACQNQNSGIIDFKSLKDRATQNSLLEKI